jgi:hypothetical protein
VEESNESCGVEWRRQTTASSASSLAARCRVPTGDEMDVVKIDECILFPGWTGELETGKAYK